MRSAWRCVLTMRGGGDALRGGGDDRLSDTAAWPGTGLQVMKFWSQMPAQTSPPAVTVTRLVLLLE